MRKSYYLFLALIILTGIFPVACSDSGPEPDFDVTGRWKDQYGESLLILTDTNYNFTFDPPVVISQSGGVRHETSSLGGPYTRVDNSTVEFSIFIDNQIISAKATINSDHILRFRYPGTSRLMYFSKDSD